MKRFLSMILLLIVASSVFAIAPKSVGSSHARSGYDYEDIAISVAANLDVEGRMWLIAKYSYPFLFSERDKLLSLVQVAESKVDIAIANKTAIFFRQELGRFYTDDAALITVSFETEGYQFSYAKVQILGKGNSVILFLNKKDIQDFIDVVGSIGDDFTMQKALFN